MVLVLDGEELVGAKQNRIVNATILVPELSSLVIPVSCVEQGRWSYTSPQLYSEQRILSPQLRAMKAEQVHQSIRASQEFRSDQSAIWDGISEKATRMRAESSTLAMSEIYERAKGSLEDYLCHFSPVENQLGALFFINGKVVGLDSFGKSQTFTKVFNKLVKSYALDAVDMHEPDKAYETNEEGLKRFLDASAEAPVESRASVGWGTDCRLESKDTTGFALVGEGHILHLSLFTRGQDREQGTYSSRMARFTRRRRGG
jgi:hypothetical protein